MQKTALTILVTALTTAVLTVALLLFLLPAMGPTLMHQRMAETMPATPLRGPMGGMGMMHGMMSSATPADLNTSTSRLSDQGLFQVSFTNDLDPVAINQMHSWTLYVETADGQPVENATITVSGGMPQHGHGLPTRPQVTEYLGNGRYLVEGLRFQMSGWWEVTFTIEAAGQKDTITFNILLGG